MSLRWLYGSFMFPYCLTMDIERNRKNSFSSLFKGEDAIAISIQIAKDFVHLRMKCRAKLWCAMPGASSRT